MMWGLLDYEPINGAYNEGDYIQSLAAAQYLPAIDSYVSREALSEYQGARLHMVLNGWFMHKPENWPPSDDIDPLFLSFHINRPFEKALTSSRSIGYLKNFSVGCRDVHTAEVLSSQGVNAYYSGCLTLTLGKTFKRDEVSSGEILLVDVSHAVPSLRSFIKAPARAKVSHIRSGSLLQLGAGSRILDKIISAVPAELRHAVTILTNVQTSSGGTAQNRLTQASERLKRYAKAKLVITSRIHTALPCLAIGTPVIFVKHGQRSLSNIYRFKGIIDLMNVVDLDGDLVRHGISADRLGLGDIDFYSPPANPQRHLELAAALDERCSQWIATRAGG